MLLVILCVTFLPFAFASIDTTCLPSGEVNALREIGRKLGKLDWDFRQDPCVGWLISSDGPRENNVTCNPEPNSTICHVVSISLKGQNLTGTLPPEFVNLPYLQNLDLTRNYLSGTIPPQWGSMERILNIFLSSNFFTGELLASFANLISMKDFRISSNNFSGRIPGFIGEWKNLTNLRIQASGLEGPIPLNITRLTTLTDLRISDLRGPDTLCPPFENTSFKYLRISDLRGPDTLCPPFENTSFKHLILRSCNLIGELPQSIASSKLLDLSFNKLNGSIPERFIDLQDTDYIYLTGNLLSGRVPNWMTTSADNIDLSYNKFESNKDLRCQMRQTNLFASFSMDNISRKVSCLGDSSCPTNWTSLYINCGGRKLTDGKKEYESDLQAGGASDFSAVESLWGFSSTGNFLDDDNHDSYIVSGVPTNTSELYMNARTSALSLTYYCFCMHDGSYNVSLHFAEIFFTDDETYSSLGRRVFDIYIQGVRVEKDFDISDRAGGAMKAIVRTYPVNVTGSLEIRLYWAGKGTTNIPSRGVYGPLISAISVDPSYVETNKVLDVYIQHVSKFDKKDVENDEDKGKKEPEYVDLSDEGSYEDSDQQDEDSECYSVGGSYEGSYEGSASEGEKAEDVHTTPNKRVKSTAKSRKDRTNKMGQEEDENDEDDPDYVADKDRVVEDYSVDMDEYKAAVDVDISEEHEQDVDVDENIG